MTEKPVTRAKLIAEWAKFKAVQNEWNRQTKPLIPWNGSTVVPLNQSMEDAIAAIVEFTRHSNFEPDAYDIVLAIDSFWIETKTWASAIAQTQNAANPSGSRQMWAAVSEIDSTIKTPVVKMPEPIEQLLSLEPKVSYSQICKIYGWVDEDGNPQEHMVQEERQKPGTHINAKWVHPDIKRRRKMLADSWKRREIDASDVQTALNPPPQPKNADWRDPGPAPEPIEELLRIPNITIDQVARMKQITPDEVRAAAVELRIPIDAGVAAAIGRASSPDNMRNAHRLTELATSEIVSRYADYEIFENIDERISAAMDDAVPMVAIFRLAKQLDPTITYEQLRQRVEKLRSSITPPMPATVIDNE